MTDKKETAQEVPVQEQHIKVRCKECSSYHEISKICSNCNTGYEEENNYCTLCGNKLVSIQHQSKHVPEDSNGVCRDLIPCKNVNHTAPEVPVQEQYVSKCENCKELKQEIDKLVKDYLINDNLSMSLKEIDSDVLELVIVGSSLKLQGQALKIPTDDNKEIILSVSYLENV